MKTNLTWPFLLLTGLFAVASCGPEATTNASPANRATTTETTEGTVAAVTTKPLAAWQRELLQVAFDAASRFPMHPHRKNRGRAQDVVVAACFELGQAELALGFGERIGDWRRGCALADYAWQRARAGHRDGLADVLARATKEIEVARAEPDSQDWRADMIAMKVARAWTALGETELAAKASAGVDPASANAVDGSWASIVAERVERIAPDRAGAELATIDADFPSMTIGQQAAAGELLARLHARFFADATLRAAIEKRPAVLWDKLMPTLRLQVLDALIRTNQAHGETPAALALLAIARTIVANHVWRPEDELPQRAALIELGVLCGERDRAKQEAEAARTRYHEVREQIVNIYRARALRPLALAWASLGEPAAAADLLALVLEEGMENPNSRPRCDDLVDTCVALVVRGLEPGAAQAARIREIAAGLGEPW